MGEKYLWLGLTILTALLLAGIISQIAPDGGLVINTIQVFNKFATGPDTRPAPDNFQNNWQIEDFQVAGFRVNSSSGSVLRILGEPLGRNRGWQDFGPGLGYRFYWETWEYPGLKITFTNSIGYDGSRVGPDKVYRIEVAAKHILTYRGVKVGDSLSQVRVAYGPGQRQGDFYYYRTDHDYFIKFKENQGEVAAIELGADYLK